MTPRQREILDLIVAGHDVSSISAQLGISLWTVKRHVTKICRAVGVRRMHEIPEALASADAAQ